MTGYKSVMKGFVSTLLMAFDVRRFPEQDALMDLYCEVLILGDMGWCECCVGVLIQFQLLHWCCSCDVAFVLVLLLSLYQYVGVDVGDCMGVGDSFLAYFLTTVAAFLWAERS